MAHARRRPQLLGRRAPRRRVAHGPVHPGVRPRRHPARRVRRQPVHPRLRRHLAEPVSALLLGPVLLTRQRRRLPRPAEGPRRGSAAAHERRTPDRPVRQDPAARGRPRARRRTAARPSRRSPSSSAPPSTCTPTGSPRWACGTPGPPATTPSRSSTRCWPTRRYAVPHALLVDIAETMARYGRLRLEKHPVHGLVLASHRPAGARGGAARQEGRAAARRAPRRRRPSRCTPPSAATSSRRCSSSAGPPRTSPGTSTARPTRSTCARTAGRCASYQREAAESFWHGGSGRRRAAVRRRQDARRRGRDGAGPGHHADPGHQHRLRPAVEGRAAPAHLADRGRDRRVLRHQEGDPPGHHRDVPGDDHPPEGRLHPPRAVRRPRLGPGRLRRGAPAAGADLPDDRRPAGAPPARADRDAGARGRPRGRRVLA